MSIKKFKRKYKEWESKVAHILEKFPFTRNSDELLYLMLIKIYYPDVLRKLGVAALHEWIPEKLAEELPKFETISRIRRKLNERGLYLPTDPEVLRRRRRGEEVWRSSIVRV